MHKFLFYIKFIIFSYMFRVLLCILVYGAVWQIPAREVNTILSTEMDVLRRSARKSKMEE